MSDYAPEILARLQRTEFAIAKAFFSFCQEHGIPLSPCTEPFWARCATVVSSPGMTIWTWGCCARIIKSCCP